MSAPIYKQEIHPSGVAGIPGKLLHVHEQHGGVFAWYLSDGGWTEIEVVPTGASSPHGMDYFGTVHLSGGALVFHVFVR